MESEKIKVEALFGEVEQRLADTSKLTVAERHKELEQLDPLLVALSREFERFQMIAFNKYPSEIDEMEERLARIKASVSRMSLEGITISGLQNEPKLQESDVVMEEADPTTQLVAMTNAKLEEGKARALNMLKLANNMRDELNMMDDEVMLQREKLLSINNQIKHAQSVTNQTKRLVSYFTKAVNDDKIIRGLIVVVAVLLLVIVGMAMSIKMRKGKLVEIKAVQEKEAQVQADYSRIDEKYFFQLAAALAPDEKELKSAKKMLKKQLKKNKKLEEEKAKSMDSGTPKIQAAAEEVPTKEEETVQIPTLSEAPVEEANEAPQETESRSPMNRVPQEKDQNIPDESQVSREEEVSQQPQEEVTPDQPQALA